MILVATNDLFFRTKIEEVAKQTDVKISFVQNFDEVLYKATKNDCNLLIVDLNFEEFDPIESIRKLKIFQPHIHVIGYLSHVQTELKENALRIGCDEVLPRSQFSRNLSEILTKNNLK